MRTQKCATSLYLRLVWGWAIAVILGGAGLADPIKFVQSASGAGRKVRLAAAELRRYVYLRSGTLPLFDFSDAQPSLGTVVVAVKGDSLASHAPAASKVDGLGPEQYALTTAPSTNGGSIWWIVGGDDQGVLYGAYRFAELLGVRFYLHGDVVSEDPWNGAPAISEVGKPQFALRGTVPFYDFPEGSDSWNREEYLGYAAQVAKMRMNVVGWHGYPGFSDWDNGWSEPLVWTGLPRDLAPDGTPRVVYSATLADNVIGWGAYVGFSSGAMSNGGADLYANDWIGSEILDGLTPLPVTPSQKAETFNRLGATLGDFIRDARGLGIKTVIGMNVLANLPGVVSNRLFTLGVDPSSPAAGREIYHGMLERLWRVCPPDYYWLWGAEQWQWIGVTTNDLAQIPFNYGSLADALQFYTGRIRSAAAGWILGPYNNETLLQGVLTPDVPIVHSIPVVGNSPMDLSLFGFDGREKWTVVWPEQDGVDTSAQLWAGRTLFDAAEAHWSGSRALLGYHWLTKVVAPSIAAQELAGWDTSFIPDDFVQARQTEGVIGGYPTVNSATIAGAPANEQNVYQTLRFGNFSYILNVPAGAYTVALKFAEPLYDTAGKRVFDIVVQGLTVATNFDIGGTVGKSTALDLVLTNVAVHDGRLTVGFISKIEFPMICGIKISNNGGDATHPAYLRGINCGGASTGIYDAEPAFATIPGRDVNRALPAAGVYTDFAKVNFGLAAAGQIGAFLASIEGTALPHNSGWDHGPGTIFADPRPWLTAKGDYAFVDQFAALRPLVTGPASLERFDYWLNQFRINAAEAEVGCARGKLDASMAALGDASDVGQKAILAQAALADRIALRQAWDKLARLAIGKVSDRGEMGIFANLDMHCRLVLNFVGAHDADLAAALGTQLPDEVNPSQNYSGDERLVVPNARTLVRVGESYRVKTIVMSTNQGPAAPILEWRALGDLQWTGSNMVLLGRKTFEGSIPPQTSDFEWRVRGRAGDGSTLTWPSAGPAQTVVIWNPPPRPAAPTGLKALATANGLLLTWDPSPDAATYNIRRSYTLGGPYELIATNLAGAAVHDQPERDKRAYYVVAAVNEDFESVDSTEVEAAVGNPPTQERLVNLDIAGGGTFRGSAVLPTLGLWNEWIPNSGEFSGLNDDTGAATPLTFAVYGYSALLPLQSIGATNTDGLLGDGLAMEPGTALSVFLYNLPPGAHCRLVAFSSGGAATFSGALTGAVTPGSNFTFTQGVNFVQSDSVVADDQGTVVFYVNAPTPGGAVPAGFNGLQLQWETPPPSVPSLLTATRLGSNVVLAWSTGQLYSSSDPKGPFIPVAGATSPFTVTQLAQRAFFLVR
jgi:Malectin domain